VVIARRHINQTEVLLESAILPWYMDLWERELMGFEAREPRHLVKAASELVYLVLNMR